MTVPFATERLADTCLLSGSVDQLCGWRRDRPAPGGLGELAGVGTRNTGAARRHGGMSAEGSGAGSAGQAPGGRREAGRAEPAWGGRARVRVVARAPSRPTRRRTPGSLGWSLGRAPACGSVAAPALDAAPASEGSSGPRGPSFLAAIWPDCGTPEGVGRHPQGGSRPPCSEQALK